MTRQTERSIRKLKLKEVPQFQAYLRSMVREFIPLGCSKAHKGFVRDRLGSREDSVLDFFLIHAPVLSGRSKRYWCGSEKTFYACYLKYCLLMGPSAPSILFHPPQTSRNLSVLKHFAICAIVSISDCCLGRRLSRQFGSNSKRAGAASSSLPPSSSGQSPINRCLLMLFHLTLWIG